MKKLGILLGAFLIFLTLMIYFSSVRHKFDGPQVISYMDAAKYEGQIVTVRTPIKYAFYEEGKEMFFSSRVAPHHAHLVPEGGDRSGFFTVSIPKEAFSVFPENYADLLKNKEVLVTGTMTWFQGDPHINVTEQSQIYIL